MHVTAVNKRPKAIHEIFNNDVRICGAAEIPHSHRNLKGFCLTSVAAQLDVFYYVINCCSGFVDNDSGQSFNKYAIRITPNLCMPCNGRIKFYLEVNQIEAKLISISHDAYIDRWHSMSVILRTSVQRKGLEISVSGRFCLKENRVAFVRDKGHALADTRFVTTGMRLVIRPSYGASAFRCAVQLCYSTNATPVSMTCATTEKVVVKYV